MSNEDGQILGRVTLRSTGPSSSKMNTGKIRPTWLILRCSSELCCRCDGDTCSW